ncbi:MAG TPA: hypothetical protein VN519_02635 [Bryobacteraceae bacterium]|nr:hypothetical protein [Bryobacteraceae bacterium]
MRNKWLYIVFCGALVLGGCSKSGPAGPTATVSLRDGTTFAGTVTKSDTTGITLTSANGETRTYPMSQVDSISYANGAPGSTGNETTADTAAPSTAETAPAANPTTPPPPPPPAATPAAPVAAVIPTRTVAAGARIVVRNSERIQAGVAEVGQTFPAVVVNDVMGSDGGLAILKGSDATLVVRESVAQGKVQGRSEIALDLASVTVRGHRYRLDTQDVVEQGTQGVGKNKRSAKFIGGGAALGAIIGAVAGGGKGAAIGAAAGAGAGAGTQALTRGKSVSVPPESILTFELDAPLRIRLTN